MKLVNVMNFVRARHHILEKEPKMLSTTADEIALVKKYNLENTFLVQYDVLLDEGYMDLFKKEKDDKMEIGFWFECVRPLVLKVGLPWRGRDCDWDWKIVPGFLMAYTPKERELLIDEAMRLFKEKFGYYPKSVGSWLLDTYSMNYMSEKYDIKAFGICRDQVSTDAYTLVGGVMNAPYFGSKYNMMCPAQTMENRIKTPIFKLLVSCPIHNFEHTKYFDTEEAPPSTMEPTWWKTEESEMLAQWYYKTLFDNENMGLSYAQLGQENGFLSETIIESLDIQLKELTKRDNVQIVKMCDAGEMVSKAYELTPPSSSVAYDDWAGKDLQSAFYNCKNYVGNLFFNSSKLFIRGLFKFDELFKEAYLDVPCETWDAIYENLPIMDTQEWGSDDDEECGIFIDGACGHFTCKGDNGVLTAVSGDKEIIFDEEKITFKNCSLTILWGKAEPEIKVDGNVINFAYKGMSYSLKIDGDIVETDGGLKITSLKDIVFHIA